MGEWLQLSGSKKAQGRGKQNRELSFLLLYNRASSDARQHHPSDHPEAPSASK